MLRTWTLAFGLQVLRSVRCTYCCLLLGRLLGTRDWPNSYPSFLQGPSSKVTRKMDVAQRKISSRLCSNLFKLYQKVALFRCLLVSSQSKSRNKYLKTNSEFVMEFQNVFLHSFYRLCCVVYLGTGLQPRFEGISVSLKKKNSTDKSFTWGFLTRLGFDTFCLEFQAFFMSHERNNWNCFWLRFLRLQVWRDFFSFLPLSFVWCLES